MIGDLVLPIHGIRHLIKTKLNKIIPDEGRIYVNGCSIEKWEDNKYDDAIVSSKLGVVKVPKEELKVVNLLKKMVRYWNEYRANERGIVGCGDEAAQVD